MSEDPTPISMAEAHAAGFCIAGQRRWLNANAPGWRQYITTGFPVDVVRGWNAALAERVLKLREERRG